MGFAAMAVAPAVPGCDRRRRALLPVGPPEAKGPHASAETSSPAAAPPLGAAAPGPRRIRPLLGFPREAMDEVLAFLSTDIRP
jgi:hypothetical protein